MPEDADVVFVLGPREPFAPEELSALERYAKHGGRLFLALDVDGRSASARRLRRTKLPQSSQVFRAAAQAPISTN